MKKKTIEQKAKAYDEALECAKSALDCLADDYICTHLTKDDIRGMYAKFFPELGGNEDEKIRKSLSAYFVKFKEDDMWDNDFSFGDIVAWLEKQGEQKHTDTDNKFIKMRETKPKDISEFLDRLTTVEQEFLWEHIAKIRELDKEEREPQGKSALETIKEEKVDNRNYIKPADKVEPKFHEGEWITIKE